MARRTRNSETRNAEQRPDMESQFQSTLFFPRHRWAKGMTCRWIRVAAAGRVDNENWAKAHQRGWRPVPADQAPEYSIPNPDGTTTPGAIIRVADHILCQKPTAQVERDKEDLQQMTRDRLRYLDEFVRENPDADVPRFNYSPEATNSIERPRAFKD